MRKYRVLSSRCSTEDIDEQMQRCAMEMEIEREAVEATAATGGGGVESIRSPRALSSPRGISRLMSLQTLKGEQSLRRNQYPTTEAYLEAQIEQLRVQNVDLLQQLARFHAKEQMHQLELLLLARKKDDEGNNNNTTTTTTTDDEEGTLSLSTPPPKGGLLLKRF